MSLFDEAGTKFLELTTHPNASFITFRPYGVADDDNTISSEYCFTFVPRFGELWDKFVLVWNGLWNSNV